MAVVTGVSSGVGVASLQSAKALGAKVIGTSGSQEKLDKLKPQGLDLGLVTRAADFHDAVMKATDGKGVNLVINTVGGSVFAECVRSMAFEGRLATVGYVDNTLEAKIDIQALHAKRLSLFGVSNKLRTPEQRASGVPAFVRRPDAGHRRRTHPPDHRPRLSVRGSRQHARTWNRPQRQDRPGDALRLHRREKNMTRKIALAAALMLCGLGAAAQYPSKPIRLVVGFAPGGAADTVARVLGEHLGRALGQAIVIENRAGAGSSIAAENVARSAPDGYSVLIASPASISVNPALNAEATTSRATSRRSPRCRPRRC